MRLFIEDDRGLVAGLNIYSHEPAAFDQTSEAIAHLLATHGAMAVGIELAQAKSRHLEQALKSSREIGVAMGILMANEKVTVDQAFNLLRVVSQRTHRKIVEVASDVVLTGTMICP